MQKSQGPGVCTTPIQKPAPAPRVTWQVNGHSPVASLGQPVQRAQVLPGLGGEAYAMQQQHGEAGGLPTARESLSEEEALALHLDGALALLHARHTCCCAGATEHPAHVEQGGCPEGTGLSCSSKGGSYRNSGTQNTWRNDCKFSSLQLLSRV